MRGEQLLFREKATQPKPAKKNSGRNSVLLAERNKAICNRYYFYTAFLPLKYDVVIKLVADDFYLAPYTVIEILSSNTAQLQAIKKEKPTAKDLSKVYLHFNWDITDIQKKAASLVA
jgi:hypothetical protein